jgi:hypothetical protein
VFAYGRGTPVRKAAPALTFLFIYHARHPSHRNYTAAPLLPTPSLAPAVHPRLSPPPLSRSHLLTLPLAHALTRSLAHSLTFSLSHPITLSLSHTLTHTLSHFLNVSESLAGMPPLVRPPSAVARVWQDSQVSLSLSERERLTPPPLLSHSLTLSLAHSLTLSRTLSLAQRERGFGGDAATGQSPFRCRASLALTRQSRPDVGLGLSHFQYESLENHLSCFLQLPLRLNPTPDHP